jgi:hypothetical protein
MHRYKMRKFITIERQFLLKKPFLAGFFAKTILFKQIFVSIRVNTKGPTSAGPFILLKLINE